MIYVPISARHVYSHWTDHKEFGKYREWLEENAGAENLYWKWNRGDLVAQGVWIEDHEVALMFKLKFGL